MKMIYVASYSKIICTTLNLEQAKDAIKKDADRLTAMEKMNSIKNQGCYNVEGYIYDEISEVGAADYTEECICDGRLPDFYLGAKFVQEKIGSDIELIFED